MELPGLPTVPSLVTLQHFRDIPEALLAKGKLESAGITCMLADGNLVRMDWLLSNAIGGIRLHLTARYAKVSGTREKEEPPQEIDGKQNPILLDCPGQHLLPAGNHGGANLRARNHRCRCL